MSLEPPESIQQLQGKLYANAKAEPAYRFYRLYDKMYREDILASQRDQGAIMVKNRSTRSKTLLIVVAGVSVVVIAYLVTLMRQPGLPEGFVSGNGRTEAIEVDVTTKFGGRLERILGKEGDKVELDQELVRFDTQELAAQLRRAQAEVRRTEQERHFAIAVIAQRNSELSLAEKDVARSKGLYENESISLERLQRDETAVETAKAALAAARAQLSNTEAGIEAAIATSELIKTQLDDSILRAPINGQVLYRLAEPGEVLPAGGKVLTVLDPTDIYMTLFLPTEEAARVAVGAEARVVLEGVEEVVIPAKVSFVAPGAQFTPKEVETRTEREKLMFRLKVQLDAGFLETHAALAKTGIPGVAYIRLDANDAWPASLQSVERPQ